MSGGAVSKNQRSQYGTGGTLIPIQETIERVLALSRADACIVIASQQTCANIRWANNTVTTNGETQEVSLSVISIAGRRAASITRTSFPPSELEAIVRESEAACARMPEAPDYMPLIEGDAVPAAWETPHRDAGMQALRPFAPRLGAMFERARRTHVETFGYAERTGATVWLAASTGLRRRYDDNIGKVEVTAKTPDFAMSSWAGTPVQDFAAVDPEVLFDTLDQRLAWSANRIELPAGAYEVLLQPSCAADLGLAAFFYMMRRDADEGKSPYSRPGGGTRIGEKLFGDVSMYSDPAAPGIAAAPFHVSIGSGSASSVFDNGLATAHTDWVRNGVLRNLVTPRYWAVKTGGPAVPFIDNLVVAGDGAGMEDMIARTERALLVTCLWYIRTVDPQTALLTGLTRDGVFLVEDGKVRGAVNNFRWNMSPIAALAQAVEIGASSLCLPREHDDFLRVKAPPLRIERFNMSSVSRAT